MSVFDFLKKRPIDKVEGGELDLNEESGEKEIAEAAIIEGEKERKEKEMNERINKVLIRINALIGRVELIERKIDRLEKRTGIKNEEL